VKCHLREYRRIKMASLTSRKTADLAVNGLGATTHVLSITDITTDDIDAIVAEAENEGFTVVGIEASNSGATQDDDLVILQGTGTPSITGTTLLGTITQA